jgi:prephenate dehydratase
VTVNPYYDTAGAAKMIAQERRRDAAAIASLQAAADYGLAILRAGIESDHRNFTRFLIIGKKQVRPNKNAKTSLIFTTKNIPGALFKCLSVFALRNINLLKIE